MDNRYLKLKTLIDRGDYVGFIEECNRHSKYKQLPLSFKIELEKAILKDDNMNNKKIVKSSCVEIVDKQTLSLTIKSQAKGLSKTFEKGLVIVNRTNPNEIEELWDNVLYSVEKNGIRETSLFFNGDVKVLGRSEEAKRISRSFIVLLHKKYRVKVLMNVSGSAVNITVEQNFDRVIPIANEQTESRATKQYFGHVGIDRFTSSIRFYLRSKYLLEDAISQTVFRVTEYNREHKTDNKAVAPATKDELDKIADNLISYIKNHADIYNIPLYTPEEIKELILPLSKIELMPKVRTKDNELEKLARQIAKVTTMTFEEALTMLITKKSTL